VAKTDDSGNLSIDFLAGFTIFIIAFIWVVSLVPGLLIDLQGYTIDYDAVAYRTGVILVEDPGVTGPTTGQVPSWEVHEGDVARFGLAVSRADPNILAYDKVNRFFDNTEFTYPDDYQNKAVFGTYRFNVSLHYLDTAEPEKSVGSPVNPLTGDDSFGFGYIRRFVKVKTVPAITINGNTYSDLVEEGYINGDKYNATRKHLVTVVLNNTELTSEISRVRDPAYQVIPGRDSFYINFTNLKDALWSNTSPERIKLDNCFDIKLKKDSIYISDGTPPNIYINTIIIKNNDGSDEHPVTLSVTPETVSDKSVSIPWNTASAGRDLIDWESQKITVNVNFALEPKLPQCAECPLADEKFCYGSRFLNTTVVSLGDNPFNFNYTASRVTQPELKDAMLEVAVW
jgi:hypothetical protein